MKLKQINVADKSMLLILSLGLLVIMMIYRLSHYESFQHIIEKSAEAFSKLGNFGSVHAAAPTQGAAIVFNPLEKSAPEEIKLLSELAKRNKELDEKERKLRETGILILAAEKNLDLRLKGFEELKKELTERVAEIKKEEDKNVANLVKMYEVMSPQQAATIFDGLPIKLVKILIMRMKQKIASQILSNMRTEKASDLTRAFLESNVATTA